ncbi:MAG TPA: hypothetical protein VGR00_03265, partial [Thermoanaerobaculia bacterium]|nr:hypothetical protein [Thermoanaerobaculia bacterium]
MSMKRLVVAAAAVLFLASSAKLQADASSNPKKKTAPVAKAGKSSSSAKAAAPASARKSGPPISSAGRAALSRYLSSSKNAPPGDDSAEINATPPATAAVEAVSSPPLYLVPLIPPPSPGEEGHEHRREPIRPNPPKDNGEPDLARQSSFGPIISAPSPTGVSFEGVGTGIAGFVPSSNPPDTNGRVGATQYVQWNNTSFAVWDKSGSLLYGPAAGNTLFQSLGGACATHNDGDPVVAYDILAGRWVLSQFVVGASPNYSHQCVAVSKTQDATGGYFLYDFVTDAVNFVDYPKIGVWPDGYYMSGHVFNAAGTAYVAGRIYVFERTQMLQGLTARMVSANMPNVGGQGQYGFLPADLDSLTPPPAGEAEFVMGPDNLSLARIDSTRVAVTWGATPAIAPLSTTRITVTSAGNPPCLTGDATNFPRSCVPQPGVTNLEYLDDLSFHFMYRLPYRNFGGAPVQESLVANIMGNGSGGTHS